MSLSLCQRPFHRAQANAFIVRSLMMTMMASPHRQL